MKNLSTSQKSNTSFYQKKVKTLFPANSFDSLTTLKAFDVDIKNPYFCSEDGVLFTKNKDKLVHYPASKAEQFYTIPNTVIRCLFSCFTDTKNLNFLVIPESVVNFESAAFLKCNSIKNITVFRHPRQEKIKFLGTNFSETTFQKENITYIYPPHDLKTCKNIMLNQLHNFPINVFILMVES